MDVHVLFKQLTQGVKFTAKRKLPVDESKKVPAEKGQQNGVQAAAQSENENVHSQTKVEQITDKNNADKEEVAFEYLKNSDTLEATPAKKPRKRRTPLSEEEKARRREQERIKRLREDNSITLFCNKVPDPIETFDDLRSKYKASEALVQNLKSAYTQPTPVQMQAIPIMLSGRSLLAYAPTGSGKTIAYLVPIIHDLRAPQKVGFRALVLAPTRELAHQIFRECARLCEKTALKVHIMHKKTTQSISNKYDILIATPNRVRYLLLHEPPLIDLSNVEWFIIDEADRLLEEAEDFNFKSQVDAILAACTKPKKKMALFSATYTPPVARWKLRNLKSAARLLIGQANTASEQVEQELMFVGSESGKLLAMRNLVKEGLKPPVLVFVQSIDRAKQLFNELIYDGINVDVIHADRTQQQRDNCVRAFREGNIWVLICTELMSRGIDFKGVNLIINYDFPPTKISYIHRIGRAGRAGRSGRAITFYTAEDAPFLRDIAEIIKISGGKVHDYLLHLKRATKTQRKKFQKQAPKREEISTKIRPENAEKEQKKDKTTNENAKTSKKMKENMIENN